MSPLICFLDADYLEFPDRISSTKLDLKLAFEAPGTGDVMIMGASWTLWWKRNSRIFSKRKELNTNPDYH